MKPSKEAEVFFQGLCRFYEFYNFGIERKTLNLHVSRFLNINEFRDIYFAILTNQRNLSRHDADLLKFKDVTELRKRLLLMRGFYNGREVSRLFPEKPHIFRKGGANKALPSLTYDDALHVSALLDVSPTLLVPRNQLKPAIFPDRLWFRDENINQKSIDEFIPMLQNGAPDTSFQCGRLSYDKLGKDIGVSLLRLPNLIELSITTDAHVPVALSRWDLHLRSFAKQLSLSGPALFSVAAPFLSSGCTRIFRLTWPLNTSPSTRFRIYTRVFSPRTEEMSVNTRMGYSEHAIKSPQHKKVEVTSVIRGGFWPFVHLGNESVRTYLRS